MILNCLNLWYKAVFYLGLIYITESEGDLHAEIQVINRGHAFFTGLVSDKELAANRNDSEACPLPVARGVTLRGA